MNQLLLCLPDLEGEFSCPYSSIAFNSTVNGGARPFSGSKKRKSLSKTSIQVGRNLGAPPTSSCSVSFSQAVCCKLLFCNSPRRHHHCYYLNLHLLTALLLLLLQGPSFGSFGRVLQSLRRTHFWLCTLARIHHSFHRWWPIVGDEPADAWYRSSKALARENNWGRPR